MTLVIENLKGDQDIIHNVKKIKILKIDGIKLLIIYLENINILKKEISKIKEIHLLKNNVEFFEFKK